MNKESLMIATILLNERKWRVVSHIKPDGDTLGSASALVSAGLAMGRDVEWCGADAFPPQYSFLKNSERYRRISKISENDRCTIAVDISTLDRAIPGAAFRINMDHHAGNEEFASDVNWIEADAAATGELVYKIIGLLPCRLSKDMAEALYVALGTDSGWFRFSCTSPDTLRLAAALMEAGVRPEEVDEKLYSHESPEKIRLWGRCMSRSRRVGSHGMLSWVSREDFQETGALESDTEGLVNMMTRTEGTWVTVLLSELAKGVRCSLRSKGTCSAQALAEKWGGGGHQYAAGCTLKMSLPEAISLWEDELSHV